LTERGYELVGRNCRTRFGELDPIPLLRHANTLMLVHGDKAISEHAAHVQGADGRSVERIEAVEARLRA
jgi:Holliday junction resolvase-like predicted endonuclease